MSRRPSGNCQICGTWRRSLHRDHIIPRWKGGGDDESNIQLICANCHEDKTREDLRGIPSVNKGKTPTVETRRRMSEAASRSQRKGGHTKGKPLSEEHRASISKALQGKPKVQPPASEERKRKVSESMKRFRAAHRNPVESQRQCRKCLQVKDAYADFYWRKSSYGRVPSTICKKCKNAPKQQKVEPNHE